METRSPFVGRRMLEDACELAKSSNTQSEPYWHTQSGGLIVDLSAGEQP